MELVEISPDAEPPVCRIMDYGKHLFEEKKKKNEAKKKQKQIQVKEIKFRPVTEEGDYQVKLRNLIRFLQEGDKAKVTMMFKGREMAHMDLGRKILDRLAGDISAVGEIEEQPRLEGRIIMMIISAI